MVTDVHDPNDRWGCRVCGKAWPCEPARDDLLDQYREKPGQLAIYMCRMLEYATPVLGGEHPDVMFARFIAWTKPEPIDPALPSADAGVPRC